MSNDPIRFESGSTILQGQIFTAFVWIMEGCTVERKCRFRAGASFDNDCKISTPLDLRGQVYFGTGCTIDGIGILEGKLYFYGNGKWAARTVDGDILTSDRTRINDINDWLKGLVKGL